MRLDEGSFLQRSCHKNQILVANLEVRNQEKISFFVFNFLASWFPDYFLLLLAALQNETIARFVFAARLESFRELPPRTHRMIDRIHGHAAHMRTPPTPTRASGFSARHIHMIDISNLTDRCVSVFVNAANFAGRHFYKRVTAFEVVQSGLLTGAARNLSAAAGRQLDVVNARAERNGAQR